VVRLIDTNVLVYRFDPRDPIRQNIATRVLRDGLRHYGHVRVVNPFIVNDGEVQELPPLYA
jgi:predicted nucleic acid-binding protein